MKAGKQVPHFLQIPATCHSQGNLVMEETEVSVKWLNKHIVIVQLWKRILDYIPGKQTMSDFGFQKPFETLVQGLVLITKAPRKVEFIYQGIILISTRQDQLCLQLRSFNQWEIRCWSCKLWLLLSLLLLSLIWVLSTLKWFAFCLKTMPPIVKKRIVFRALDEQLEICFTSIKSTTTRK